MVQVKHRNMVKTCKVLGVKITKTNLKKKQEIRCLYNQLNKVLPSFDDQDLICGTDVVFKAVQHINQLHRRVANERGVEALQQIQNKAREIAFQQFMAMKAKSAKLEVRQFILKLLNR